MVSICKYKAALCKPSGEICAAVRQCLKGSSCAAALPIAPDPPARQLPTTTADIISPSPSNIYCKMNVK